MLEGYEMSMATAVMFVLTDETGEKELSLSGHGDGDIVQTPTQARIQILDGGLLRIAIPLYGDDLAGGIYTDGGVVQILQLTETFRVDECAEEGLVLARPRVRHDNVPFGFSFRRRVVSGVGGICRFGMFFPCTISEN